MALINHKILENKYEIIHEIKKGGFGIVYYGIDTQLGKPVAIKEIAPGLVEDPKYLDMFHEEALNIAKLSHNNIVHIYEFSKSYDGRLYIIMEYIDGKDLEKIIRAVRKTRQRIPRHLAVYLVAEICSALDYAHNRRDAFTNKPLNLVHQDISPSNIMISKFGGVKLIDFGIAFVKRHQAKDNKERKLRGKVPYMSPEQLLRGNHPDHRSDLFSLGLVLYEALAGERLFNSQEEVIAAGKNQKWIKRGIKASKLPSPLETILLRALEVDLANRYQSANHMYIDLLQYLISSNEGGELMDELSNYVDELFKNTGTGTPVGKVSTQEKLPAATSYEAQTALANGWRGAPPRLMDNAEAFSFRSPSSRIATPEANVSLKSELELAEEDDIKTVIDVIRISARNHQKHLYQLFLGLLLAGLVFGLFDTLNGWTPAGVWLYDRLFPPAIKLATVPPDARILLDGHEITGQTPVSIDRISPGIHKLQLNLEGYRPIVKSLFVPRDGAVRVQGEEVNIDQRSYLFRFNTEIEIESRPQGADVYVNNIRYNQKTPCTIIWEVGKPLSLELGSPGFERLTGYSLNTLEEYDVVDDRRFWQMQVKNSTYKKYCVKGVFKKDVLFITQPDGVEIYDSGTHTLLGISGSDGRISLAAGLHELELRKQNFISRNLALEIDGDFDEAVNIVLSRKVRFSASDKLEHSRKDIGAQIVYLRRGNKSVLRTSRTTPFDLTLPAHSYTAKFQKSGYLNTEIEIEPEVRHVQVEMEPLKAKVEIKVKDAATEEPVSGAEIYYNFIDRPQASDIFFDQTDSVGEGFGELPEGAYNFTVKKLGYGTLTRIVTAMSGESHLLTFKLYLAN